MVVEQFIPVETTPAFFFGDLSELEAMRLLVTAGTGQIGAALVPRLCQSRHRGGSGELIAIKGRA